MIQFNLLPDVKLEYLRAERTRKLVISIASLVTIAAVAILLLLVSITTLQRKHLSDLNTDIKNESSQLKKQTDLNKILTIQDQLGSLPTLHSTKPAASRLTNFLQQVTPAKASINNLNVDFTQHTMTITGTADSLATVNEYIDTLKFTDYTVPDPSCIQDETEKLDANKLTPAQIDVMVAQKCRSENKLTSKDAFSSVVLTSFGLTQHEADYTINLSYDQTIFDITQDAELSVPPNKVTTRSEVEQPTDLFKLPVDKPVTSTTTSTSTNTSTGR